MLSGDFSSEIFIRGQNLVGGWSRIFGSALFSEFRFAYNRVRSDSVHPAFGIDANSQFGIKGVPQDPRFYGGLPHTQPGTFSRIGGPFFRPQFQTSQVYQFAENVTWSKGSHTFKFGGELRRDLVTYIDLRSLNGELSFPDGRYSGIGLADMLLGLGSTQRLTLFHQPDLYTKGLQFYAQDSWRATDTVTVNYGIRYEYFTPLFDRNAQLTNILPANGQVVHGAGFRQRLRPDADQSRPQRLGAAGRRRLVDQGQRRDARRLRHLLPADRPLRVRKPARTQPAAAGRRVDHGQLWQRGADVHLRPGLHAAQPVDGQSRDRAVAHPGPRPEHADRAPVQRRPRVAVRPEHGGGGRLRRQPRPQRPAAAQPQSGHHRHQHRDDAHRLPVRAVRLRQRVPRADHHRRAQPTTTRCRRGCSGG